MSHYRLTAQGTLPSGDIWITGLHVDVLPGLTVTQVAAAWQTAFQLFWNGTGANNDYKSMTSTTVVCTQLVATGVGANGKNTDQSVITVSLAGTAVDDSMPQETSPVVTLRTSNASKAGRGRMYLPPMTEARNAANGQMGAGVATHIVSGAQAMIQSLNGASMSVGVWHKSSNTFDKVIAIDVANLFRVQRRRQNKVPAVRSRRPGHG